MPPLVWTKQHFNNGDNESSSGFGTTIVWHVNATPSVARADVGSPHRGHYHPDDQSLKANSVLFAPTGFGAEVTAQYVPLGFLDPPPPEDTTDAEFAKVDSYSENKTIEIPVFQLVEKKFPTVGGGVESKSVWQPVENKASFEYARTVMTLTLNAEIESGFGVEVLFALSHQIREQTNKIHTIGGKKYLFESGSMRRIKFDQYQFTYKWVFDPGVKDTRVYDLSASPSFGIIGSYGYPREALGGEYTGFVIGPHRRLDTSPHGTDPTQAPLVQGADSYEEDENGHLTLPGVTP